MPSNFDYSNLTFSPQDAQGASPLTMAHVSPPPKAKKIRKSSVSGDDLISNIFQPPSPAVVVLPDNFSNYWPELTKISTDSFIAPKTHIGIEVEVENVRRIGPNFTIVPLWLLKQDGSLRNNGHEFVTPGVLPVSLAEIALRFLKQELNSDVDFSKRTSVHIHLDIRQLTFKQLLGLLFTYVVVENLLFKFVGNNRRNNIFCVPLSETNLIYRLSDHPIQSLQAIEDWWHKYSALNLLPISKFGSIEFRHLPGTLSIEPLLQWIDLICCLKVFAYQKSLPDIIQEITRLNSNSRYHQFVESVFGERCVFLDMSNLLVDMEKSVYLVKHAAAANQFHQRVIKSAEVSSQLGVKLNAWLRKLKPIQQKALVTLGKRLERDNLEELFKSIVRYPGDWLNLYSEHELLIWDIIGKSKTDLPHPPTSAAFDRFRPVLNPKDLLNLLQMNFDSESTLTNEDILLADQQSNQI